MFRLGFSHSLGINIGSGAESASGVIQGALHGCKAKNHDEWMCCLVDERTSFERRTPETYLER